jgi:transposase
MSMGTRNRNRQPSMWVTTTELPTAASHPFYARLNELLREHGFDDFAEAQCAEFYAEMMGRPSRPPGIYFRLLLIGYFEGIDSERVIAWRAADSLVLRDFLGVGLENAPPDHSTISRTRRLIDLEAHRAVFTWVLQCLSTAGLVKGKLSVSTPRHLKPIHVTRSSRDRMGSFMQLSSTAAFSGPNARPRLVWPAYRSMRRC